MVRIGASIRLLKTPQQSNMATGMFGHGWNTGTMSAPNRAWGLDVGPDAFHYAGPPLRFGVHDRYASQQAYPHEPQINPLTPTAGDLAAFANTPWYHGQDALPLGTALQSGIVPGNVSSPSELVHCQSRINSMKAPQDLYSSTSAHAPGQQIHQELPGIIAPNTLESSCLHHQLIGTACDYSQPSRLCDGSIGGITDHTIGQEKAWVLAQMKKSVRKWKQPHVVRSGAEQQQVVNYANAVGAHLPKRFGLLKAYDSDVRFSAQSSGINLEPFTPDEAERVNRNIDPAYW
jgi:hypothetical protein